MRSLAKTVLLGFLLLQGCGTNMLASSEKADPAEDATLALEKGDEDKAISILEDALADDPENPQYLSILSLAHAQRAGVEPLAFAQRISASSAGSQTSTTAQVGGSYGVMFDALPEATPEHLDDIDQSVQILASIKFDEHLPGDEFKLALYQTASMFMHIKVLDTNGDGTLSIDEVTSLSDTSAAGLVAQLFSAQAILASGDPNDPSIQKATAALAKYKDQIDAAGGSTDEEKLKNYLATTSGAAAAQP